MQRPFGVPRSHVGLRGCRLGLGRQRRREGRAGRSRAPAAGAQRRLGRQARAAPARGTRSSRSRSIVEADRRGHSRHSPPAAPAAASPRRPGDRTRPPRRRSHAVRRPADPDLRRPLHERHRRAHARGLEGREPGRARDTTGWKPVQLVPENARAGRGGFPLSVEATGGPGASGSRSTSPRSSRRRYEATTVTADGTARRRSPSSCEVFDFTLPDANSLHVMVYYEPISPSFTRAATSTPRITASRTATASSSSTPTTRPTVQRPSRPIRRDATSRRGRLRGAGRRASGTRSSRASFYGPGRDVRASARAPGSAADSWMTFLGRSCPEGDHLPLLPDEPRPARVSAHVSAWRRTFTRIRARRASCRSS